MADLGKGVLVILLVFIGLGLVLYLLINNINIPSAAWAPFVDGSRIRIRALTNDQYLVPVTSNDVNGARLSFTGEAGPSSIWQLCQDQSETSERGRYLFYRISDQSPSGTYITFGSTTNMPVPIVVVSGESGLGAVTCADIRSGDPNNFFVMELGGAYFQLVEDGSSLFGNVTSNVYNIISSSSGKYLYYSPINNNPATMLTEPTDVNQIEYAFVIEVVPA